MPGCEDGECWRHVSCLNPRQYTSGQKVQEMIPLNSIHNYTHYTHYTVLK